MPRLFGMSGCAPGRVTLQGNLPTQRSLPARSSEGQRTCWLAGATAGRSRSSWAPLDRIDRIKVDVGAPVMSRGAGIAVN